MGNFFAKAFGGSSKDGKMFGGKDVRILLLGLDNSGKTTILYKLKLKKELPETIPTVGFNTETVKYKNISFQMWDCGGQDSIRPLWRHYYSGSQGLIFVVDSTDRDRIEEARQELHKIIENPEMSRVPIVIFANKQDLGNALNPTLLAKYLQLDGISNNKEIFPVSAVSGDGLTEALQWLSRNIEVPMGSSSTLSRR